MPLQFKEILLMAMNNEETKSIDETIDQILSDTNNEQLDQTLQESVSQRTDKARRVSPQALMPPPPPVGWPPPTSSPTTC